MKNNAFKKDLYRYYGEKGETLIKRVFRPVEVKYLRVLRKLQSKLNPVFYIWYRLKLYRMQKKTHIQIHATTKIGEGFYIGHTGRIIINDCAVIGKNVNIATGVTIGRENRGKRIGCPVIGNNCWIGTNSVIVGNVTIGDDVLIAPLSYVNFDVPSHSIVIGNPGKIISRDNATEGYINNTID